MLLSIITINFNNAIGLEKTIKSVISQTTSDIEYIVIDGASKDKSVDIIKQYFNDIDYWTSEPDSGIYNAMNKGIKKAHGDYCLFLNSGDWLINNTIIEDILKNIDGKSDIYYTNAKYTADKKGKNRTFEYPEHLDIDFFIAGSINHQNSFIKTDLFIKLGLYDEKFKIVGDWFFFLNACKSHVLFTKINIFVSYCEPFGIGGLPAHAETREQERKNAIQIVFGELAPSINSLREFRTSIYANTLAQIENPKIYFFYLRIFRFLVVKINNIVKRKK